MEFTGERYLPSLEGEIKYEHLHRYALCIDFVTGKSVLDIASGEGYGCALLARVAESVVGVDISSEAVDYAAQEYGNYNNLKFMVGSCEAVPLPDQSVDVVTSFETIEHHGKHEEMMLEIKRVLKPGGILIISSPNRLTYSDLPNYSNPFHVKELYYDELVSLLNSQFKYMKIYGQKLATSSFVFPLNNAQEASLKSYTGNLNNLSQKAPILKSPIYFIAICSDNINSVQSAIDSVYIDESDDVLKSFELALDKISKMLANSQSQLERSQLKLEQSQSQLEQSQFQLHHSQLKAQDLETRLHHSQLKTQDLETRLHHSQLKAQDLETRLHHSQLKAQESQSQLQQIQEDLEQSQLQLQQAQGTIAVMQISRFWQMRTQWIKLKKLLGFANDT
ncbi:MAG: methyltransferase domain-containing protein [Nostocaceae cyanobacterium]|nr:methyltransferase domain-containing protein [Nostocaceae cyanobacterium]